ncbi:dfp2-like protein 15 [Dermatophagoides farinae]|uniref:Dfp2-like protein 15 n=1 Tax=Dermatophagoides farinae TaxID=6954 RepID=A0A9D4P434_DERFA|nr:dfp2-like protein 15 [Dermatophagoides farinae]
MANIMKHYLIILTMFMTTCCQVIFAHGETFGHAAMTTVLARPLGGYGLTPLVFEPSPITTSLMQGSSSNSVATKVRKSPVYELIMPTFDEELPITGAASEQSSSQAKILKKMTYDTLIPSQQQQKQSINKITSSSLPSSSSSSSASTASSTSDSNYFQSVMDLLKIKDTASSPSSYNSVMAPMGGNNAGYKGGNGGFGNPQSNGGFFNSMSQHSSYGGNGGSGGYSGNVGAGAGSGPTGPLTAAINSIRSLEVKEVQDSYENSEPQVIDIPPSAMPIVINFRTSASQIQIHQSHEPGEPKEVQETQSEDEPHFLRHSVTKPVIQEVHEIIMPYRRVIQEIRPVEEEVKTIVARQAQGKGGVAGGVTGGLGLGGGLNMMGGIGGLNAGNAGSAGYGGNVGTGSGGGGLGNGIRIINGGSSGNGNGGYDKGGNVGAGGKKSSGFNGNALQYAIDKLTSSVGPSSGGGGGGEIGSSPSAGNKYKSKK